VTEYWTVSKKARPIEDRTALISVHDVSPLFEDDFIKTCDMLQDFGIEDYTLLVTPFYAMRQTNNFQKHEIFTRYVESLGLEISLHGYSHMTKAGGNAEFAKMSPERMASRLKLGYSLMRKTFGTPPVGFIPPLWKAPVSLVQVASELGLRYCVVADALYYLKTGEKLETAYTIVSQGDKRVNHVDALLELELGGPVQIAVHPCDYASPKMQALIRDMIDRLGYRFIGYRSFLRERYSNAPRTGQ
jgi:predicted deacetylase